MTIVCIDKPHTTIRQLHFKLLKPTEVIFGRPEFKIKSCCEHLYSSCQQSNKVKVSPVKSNPIELTDYTHCLDDSISTASIQFPSREYSVNWKHFQSTQPRWRFQIYLFMPLYTVVKLQDQAWSPTTTRSPCSFVKLLDC